jgi:hypothetical protein
MRKESRVAWSADGSKWIIFVKIVVNILPPGSSSSRGIVCKVEKDYRIQGDMNRSF